MRRLERDRPSVRPIDRFSVKEILLSLTSPHVILLFVVFFFLGTTLYGLALFLPSIVHQLGFSPIKSQLLSVGPFAAAFVREWLATLMGRSITDEDLLSNVKSL